MSVIADMSCPVASIVPVLNQEYGLVVFLHVTVSYGQYLLSIPHLLHVHPIE